VLQIRSPEIALAHTYGGVELVVLFLSSARLLVEYGSCHGSGDASHDGPHRNACGSGAGTDDAARQSARRRPLGFVLDAVLRRFVQSARVLSSLHDRLLEPCTLLSLGKSIPRAKAISVLARAERFLQVGN
jgi:hypothetical protein